LRKKQKKYKTQLNGKFKEFRKEMDDRKREEDSAKREQKQTSTDDTDKSDVVKQPKTESEDDDLLKLRKDLPKLTNSEKVLAKWPDDGWYYSSTVKESLGNHKYRVEDDLGDREDIYREDIIKTSAFQVTDKVVAMHPQYRSSYAPGEIVSLVPKDRTKLIVKFYDSSEWSVSRSKVFKLPAIKFTQDVDDINKLEESWLGQTVVARNDNSKVYQSGWDIKYML
jgi:hypothetical protein